VLRLDNIIQMKSFLLCCLISSHFLALNAFAFHSTKIVRRQVSALSTGTQQDPKVDVAPKLDIEEAVNDIELYDEANELSWKDREVRDDVIEKEEKEVEPDDEQVQEDERYMRKAIKMAESV